MNITFRQLKGFMLVAAYRNFTRAADQMHMTQAGLSGMISDLERQLDCPLFERTTRSVKLTKEGQRFLPTAELVVSQLEEASANIRKASVESRKRLVVAMTPVFATIFAPRVFRAFSQQHPNIELIIRDIPSRDVKRYVDEGEVDVGFGIYLKTERNIRLRSILKFEFLYLQRSPAGQRLYDVSSGLPLMDWQAVPIEELVCLPGDTPVQEAINSHLSRLPGWSGAKYIYNDMQTVLAMVASGMGGSVLPSLILPSCLGLSVSAHKLVQPASEIDFYEVTKKGRITSPMMAPFVEVLSDTVSAMCNTGPA